MNKNVNLHEINLHKLPNFSLSSFSLSSQYSLFSQIKLTVDTVKEELKNNDKINTTNYEAFDYFNANDYEFLPTKPTVSFIHE